MDEKKNVKSPKSKLDVEIKIASSSRTRKNSDPDHYIEKRITPRPFKQRNDVYVNKKSSFVAHIKKCKELLNSGEDVYIHGLGAAVNYAVNLALQLQSLYPVVLDANTSTVDLMDDHYSPSIGHKVETRRNSAIRIKVHLIGK
ncbi:hypothetical protein CEXT_478781 [Caerostris extrusa]|uniref:Uncharacterized protein n=1 Tax=Caerostris extrusa TaxID=172846 RepID=A0AAV4XY01_CAEEX|nr:hypothetical protein CEXT_478781 [Caerostris extrusa]